MEGSTATDFAVSMMEQIDLWGIVATMMPLVGLIAIFSLGYTVLRGTIRGASVGKADFGGGNDSDWSDIMSDLKEQGLLSETDPDYEEPTLDWWDSEGYRGKPIPEEDLPATLDDFDRYGYKGNRK